MGMVTIRFPTFLTVTRNATGYPSSEVVATSALSARYAMVAGFLCSAREPIALPMLKTMTSPDQAQILALILKPSIYLDTAPAELEPNQSNP